MVIRTVCLLLLLPLNYYGKVKQLNNVFNLLRLRRKDEISFDVVAETVEATCDFVERTKFYDELFRHSCRL